MNNVISKFIPRVVTQTVGRTILKGQKNSPTMLFVAGVAGMIGTTVLASRATLRLDEAMDEIEADRLRAGEALKLNNPKYQEADYESDMRMLYIRSVIKVTKLYAPAIGLGVLSIAALTGSHRILSTRNTALTAAYAALELGFNEYRQRVVDELGEDKDREFRYGGSERTIIEEKKSGEIKKKQVKTVDDNSASIYARFFNEDNPNWNISPELNMVFLKCQQNWLNDKLRSRGHVFLNEAYDMLSMDHTPAGAVVGWLYKDNGQGDGYIDFGIWSDDKMTQLHNFMSGAEGSLLIDFNVDGVIYKEI